MSDSATPPQAEEPDSLTRTACPLRYASQIVHLLRPTAWIWEGYLAKGFITLLTGQWKIGKTTLLAALLARLGSGGDLAGHGVTPGRALVITEEWEGPWLRRMARHKIGDNVLFAFNPFNLKPQPLQWDNLMDDLKEQHQQKPFDLLVIDTLSAVTPGQEETSAVAMTHLLRPLRDLASARAVAVLLLHHPRKGNCLAGQAARGTGALSATVDFILEFLWSGSAAKENRRRRLHAWSRHETTPREALLELSADGTGYELLPPELTEREDVTAQIILEVLREAPGLTSEEIHARWPAGEKTPKPRSLRERLKTLIALGCVSQGGDGHRHSRFRYEVVGENKVDAVEFLK